ncbi:MAG: 50S ribosomal protein L6 [Thermoplasmata archaeon]|nr:50S ribosomal protein L6 [Thermoplasmata archaeon]
MPIAAYIEKRIPVPEGVTITLQDNILSVKGEKGEITRRFNDPKLSLSHENGEIVIFTDLPRKREKALVGTWEAHVKNMLKGVTQGFTYRMKLVYAHFPVKVSVKGDQVIIDNFVGEKSPRKARIVEGTKVSVKGDQIIIEGVDKEKVGQTMANIEQATRIKGYDPRVFQDGIYLISRE